MHRLWIGAMLILCTTAFVFAQGGELLPVWNVNPQTGVLGEVTTLARAWHGTTWDTYCNANHCIDVNLTAEVAQWMHIYLEGRNVWWRVLKPGDYATDGIAGAITSNGDVGICFSDFGDLVNVEGDIITTYWAYSTGGAQPGQPGFSGWVHAPDLNLEENCVFIPEDQEHQPHSFSLWNWIHVIPCDSACQYENHAFACVTALEQKPWVDTLTGGFLADYPPPSFPAGDIASVIDPS